MKMNLLLSNPASTGIAYKIVVGMVLALPWLILAVMVVGAGVCWIRGNRNR